MLAVCNKNSQTLINLVGVFIMNYSDLSAVAASFLAAILAGM